jgi:hypothetical protein
MKRILPVALFGTACAIAFSHCAFAAGKTPAMNDGGVPPEHYMKNATGPSCFTLTYQNSCQASSHGCLGGHNSCSSNVSLLLNVHGTPQNITIESTCAGGCESATFGFTSDNTPVVAVMACQEDDDACMKRMQTTAKAMLKH